MEKLPMGKRKSTLLKTWKRRYFKAADGWLHYYEVKRIMYTESYVKDIEL